MNDNIRIRMLKTVRPDLSFLLRQDERDMILYEGNVYNAVSNPQGAICGICDNGKKLGVKPKEFEFIEAPEWVIRIWGKPRDNITKTYESLANFAKAYIAKHPAEAEIIGNFMWEWERVSG